MNSTLNTQSSVVKIVKQNSAFSLLVNGLPFVVKGAGVGDTSKIVSLANAGGNSFRTWSTDDAEQQLALAKEHGLMVALGFDFGKELFGFDYNNEAEVKAQFERIKDDVQKYKNHPNLLCWVVANEPNLLFDKQGNLDFVNPKVYDAIEQVVRYIHQNDPNHPVTYTFAGIEPEHVKVALERTPSIDFVSVQVYGLLEQLHPLLQQAKIEKPVMVTEYGPVGHWEMPATTWGREIEEPSWVKAQNLKTRIEQNIIDDPSGLVIGNYVFYWGQKQERTPTWYGMFTKDNLATSSVDVMSEIWTEKTPRHQAPKVVAITLNDHHPIDSVYLMPATINSAQLVVDAINLENLKFSWQLLREVDERSDGGAFEAEPPKLEFTMLNQYQSSFLAGRIEFICPKEPGEYRLFGYVKDKMGKVGYANFPFYVSPSQ
ncbi:glycoside hydrolase family 2 TIM barrel-domain containing protein [Thalassotalea aquiviva]|uniref:glycoside hydrolase family 2 TIM barrel-domain containing protein n=1 Tax=Thalassotalea aquiviva TaxID=3242415 RepID=UPI003529DB12